jgi:hypothetical protein
MQDYKLTSKYSWLENRSLIADEMRLWNIKDWIAEQVGNAARLTYIHHGKTVELLMDKQDKPKDNLRVLYLAVRSMRLNEVRGISDVVGSAYIQLNAPVTDKNPYEVLGIYQDAPLEEAEAIYRIKAKRMHPDQGGDPQKFKELQIAIDKIRSKKT